MSRDEPREAGPAPRKERKSPGGIEAAPPVQRRIQVERTARYWLLGAEGSSEPTETWVVLHGYRQLARRFLWRFQAVAVPTRLIVAPEGLSRFYVESGLGRHGPASHVGASWMTREERDAEIRDYVAYLDAVLADVEKDRASLGSITILGFSQGVATAARWAVLGKVRPVRLILWGDTLPPDLDPDRAADRLSGVEILRVRGREDGALEPDRMEEEERVLTRAGLQSPIVSYPGGHDIHRATLLELAGGGRASSG
ncbi:MAG: alpha/beta hydrolase [Gemmatimonadota bacterium]